MEYSLFRPWPTSRAEAYQIVGELAPKIVFRKVAPEPKTIAAVDTAYGVGGVILYAAAVVMSFPDLVELERAFYHGETSFPYVPGLFFFREGPIMVEALSRLKSPPDVIMAAGHGMAHPRHCGLASQIGYAFNTPSVGCARKLLAGEYSHLGASKGSVQPVRLDGRNVGVAYRSKESVKPIFISPGHLCDRSSAQEIVVRCLRDYRLPEPLRLAHLLANRFRQHSERTDSGPASDAENE